MNPSREQMRMLLVAGWQPLHVARRFGVDLGSVRALLPKPVSRNLYFPTELTESQERMVLAAWDSGETAAKCAERAKCPLRLAAQFLTDERPDFAGLIGGRRVPR